MAKKKTTTPRRTKKSAGRAAEAASEVEKTSSAAAEAAPPRKPRRAAATAKKPRGRRSATAEAVDAPPAPTAPPIEVERTDQGVVIRLPPAAPPPFPTDLANPRPATAPPPPPAREFEEDEPAVAKFERAATALEDLEDEARAEAGTPGTVEWADEPRSGHRMTDEPGVDDATNDAALDDNERAGSAGFIADEDQEPPAEPADRGPAPGQRPRAPAQGHHGAGGAFAPLDPEEFRKLSPSQKRRLRRKRRALERRDGQNGEPRSDTPRPPQPAPVAESPGRPPRPTPPRDEQEPRRTAPHRPAEPEPTLADSDVELLPREERGGERAERGERGGRRRRGRRGRGRRREDDGVRPTAESRPPTPAPEEEPPDEPREDDGPTLAFSEFADADDVAELTTAEEPGELAAAVEPEPVVETEDEGPPVTPRREMIINVVPREECRIGILADGKLEEIYLERASAENHVGNIYKGVVTNVEPSIQAAFVDFGLGKNGFLHISDLHPQYFRDGTSSENVGRKMPRRRRPPIQKCLRRGQTILVQITKEGIGTKGPTLTTYLSIPGRFLVMMPGMGDVGVSRKIEDEEQRRKLRAMLDGLELPEGMGFIARTAAVDRTKRELQSDLNYLTRLWRAVERRIRDEGAPAELYRESDLVIRTIRDVFAPDVGRILVDNPEVAARAREFLSVFSPRSRETVVDYSDAEPIFHRFGIEAELERLHSRHVPLRSGGSLVIDQTEALVAIDVNSGKFRTEDDAETTAYKINMEAADEIPRQLRLRDLGGVIICDFIDMREERHRRDIERRLIHNLKQHKERAKVLRMSAFGIIEMTRQRQRASLTRSVYQDCHHCRGTGLVKTVESVALDVMRLVQLAVTREHIRLIDVRVSSEVADVLLNRKRTTLAELESRYRRSIVIRPNPAFGLDQVLIECFDSRNRLVPQG